MSAKVNIGIITVSDRASKGEYEDKSGPAVISELTAILKTPFEAITRIVADERDDLMDALLELSDGLGCSLIITTGGTGPAPRDITPEVTEEVIERLLPGFGELMRAVSFKVAPTSILSRQMAGTRGRSLIINLPGKPTAIKDCLLAVFPAIPDCIELIGGPLLETDPKVVKAHMPHKPHKPQKK